MKGLLFLIWLHHVGDYVIQNSFLAEFKAKYKYILFVHVFLWSGIISLGLELLGLFSLWKLIFLFVVHYLTDNWKCQHKDNKELGLTKLLWIDQSIHVIQILIVWYF